MQCPKCGAIGQEGPECNVCGLVFAKYAQHHQQEHQIIYDDVDKPRGLSRHINLILLLLIVMAGGFYLFGNNDNESTSPTTATATTENPPPATEAQEQVIAPETDAVAAAPIPDEDAAGEAVEAATATTDLRLVMQPSSTEVSALEQARVATVFITTPLGNGSGFFASDDCKIVTSRQLVNADIALLAQQRLLLAGLQQQHDKHSADLTRRRDSFYLHCNNDCSDNAYQQFMGEMLPQQAAMDSQLEALRSEVERLTAMHRIKVTLLDGTEVDAEVAAVSDTYHLALAIIPDAICPALPLTTLDTMQVGDEVYTLDNMNGSRNELQSGKLTGSVDENGFVYIQTSAPINTGNIGGPLLNESGSVIGVNTTRTETVAETPNLAIPANYITEAFALFGTDEEAAQPPASQEQTAVQEMPVETEAATGGTPLQPEAEAVLQPQQTEQPAPPLAGQTPAPGETNSTTD